MMSSLRIPGYNTVHAAGSPLITSTTVVPPENPGTRRANHLLKSEIVLAGWSCRLAQIRSASVTLIRSFMLCDRYSFLTFAFGWGAPVQSTMVVDVPDNWTAGRICGRRDCQ